MTTILWDTHGTEIVKTLAAERRAAGALASGLALTLVVVTDEDHAEEAQRAAATPLQPRTRAGCSSSSAAGSDADDRLDAEVQVGGRLGANEAVMMRMYGRLALHAESVVLPLLASGRPGGHVVARRHRRTSWPATPLGVLAGRRVTDAATDEDPMAALKRRAKDYAPGDTDLAWTRTTPWRALLASAFDDMAETPTSAEVHAERGNPSAALLAGWLDRPAAHQGQARRLGRPRSHRGRGPLRRRATGCGSTDRTATSRLSPRTGITDRQLPLKRRDLGELLSEELRRLDADQPYADALAVITGEKDLDERPAMRTLIWKDPEKRRSAKAAPARKSAAAAKKPAKPSARVVKKATAKKAAVTRKAAAGTAKRTAKKVAVRKATTTKRSRG